jgi:hypothetical protein
MRQNLGDVGRRWHRRDAEQPHRAARGRGGNAVDTEQAGHFFRRVRLALESTRHDGTRHTEVGDPVRLPCPTSSMPSPARIPAWVAAGISTPRST